ncbi:hypothetical protein [Nitrosopumilus sp.]|uniref:hypothetical protein n=1 Tax=Nitrosopumilus sp. TaxID=2024843 RepID=UPI00247BF925|nr:hypothetical protein [Nitrosopumilus sp.]MCV0409620.1 hypothetical protein [Nitrosopumilus sp.]
MKTRLLIIIAIVLIIIPIGFFYYISINGFSTYHAGIYVRLLSEQQLESFAISEPKTITQEELMQFPQISTMINLLLEEKENPRGTRSFFVNFDTYRIFDSHGELKIKNHMSDSGARNLYQDFTQSFESNVIVYEGNYFSISSWIA